MLFMLRVTSIVRVLLALAFFASRCICARAPVRVHLHVQLTLASRQLIVLGLLFAAERVPLFVAMFSVFFLKGY